MTGQVLTLNGLAAYAKKRVVRAQAQLESQYQAAVQSALAGLNLPGVTVRLGDETGRSRVHAGPAQFFSCRGLSKPVLEQLLLEIPVVLANEVPADPRWWQRLLSAWRPHPEPRKRLLCIACPTSAGDTGKIWLDGHLLKTFSLETTEVHA